MEGILSYGRYTFFLSVCSLGMNPRSFALLTQCSTTEPQEHCLAHLFFQINVVHFLFILGKKTGGSGIERNKYRNLGMIFILIMFI